MSKTLEKHPKVDSVDGGPGDWFIDMKPGWTIDTVASKYGDGVHCFGSDTVKEALSTLRTAEPCACNSCREIIEQSNDPKK